MGADLSGAVLDERYRIVAPLAQGAMGAVYRGERVGLGRAVAIKVMHAALPGQMSARERFEREAELMAKLAHPHCVSVLDFGVYDGKPYLVMELVRGKSLHDLIVSEGQLHVRRAADIARQLLAGIAHAHELGIIHRDIKPANIMVSPKEALGDHVQILDFGLARLRESTSMLTQGIAVGTPSYMAPEQCRGEKLDARVDVYATGVVLFEMITGRKPFVAKDPLAIVKMQLTEKPPKLGDFANGADALEDIVARALQKQPDDRYASAVEMAAAIDQAIPTRAQTAPAGVPIVPNVPNNETVMLGSSALTPVDHVDAHEQSMLRRMLPASRMKWVALFLLLLAAGAIYGIIYLKHYLAHTAAI